jgi:hypothetical protein
VVRQFGCSGNRRTAEPSNRRTSVMDLILGVETSCDETAAAVVEDGGRILS